jgi:plasmid stabilization system protein ParE
VSIRLVVRPQAEAELLSARDWYENQRAGLGQEFVDEVRETMSEVATRPLSFPKVHGEMRRAILRRFPYGVFFRTVTDEIVILGVIHGRRHPQLLKSRQ